MRQAKPLERLMSKVEPEPNTGCYLFTGASNPAGYGWLALGGRPELAHRAAWKIQRGDPGDLFVLHSCDTPACVNIDHLFLGTNADNMADMVAKGRGSSGRAKWTHCPQGHPLSGENLIVRKGGLRRCRTCWNAYQREQYRLRGQAIARYVSGTPRAANEELDG